MPAVPGRTSGIGAILAHPPVPTGTAEAVIASKLLVWTHDQMHRLVASYSRIEMNALNITLRYLAKLAEGHASMFERDARVTKGDDGRREMPVAYFQIL